MSMSYDVTNPALELTDPCPDIHALFLDFNELFFEGALACCEVKWSPRMFSCAGVCSYEGRNGMCSIRLSLPLLKLRPRKDLIETLLHEMIHAFLFVTRRNRDRDGHGPDFQYHMCRCTGPCRDRRPYFGYVKRSSNRAPGPNDLWWNAHKMSCNGTFVKVKEPEGYGQRKRRKTEENVLPRKKHAGSNTLDKYFSNAAIGRGQTCGTGSERVNPFCFGENATRSTASTCKVDKVESHSRRNDAGSVNESNTSRNLDVKVVEIELDIELNKGDRYSPPLSLLGSSEHPIELGNDPEPPLPSTHCASHGKTTVDVNFNRFVCCPSCNERIVEYFINDHLDLCLSSR